MLCVAPLFSFWAPPLLFLFTRDFMQPGHKEVEAWGTLDYGTMNWVLLGLLIAQYFWCQCCLLHLNCTFSPQVRLRILGKQSGRVDLS